MTNPTETGLPNQLWQSQQVLDISLAELDEIIRLLPASVTVQDVSGNFVLANDAAARQFGVPLQDFFADPALEHGVAAMAARRAMAPGILTGDACVTLEECVEHDNHRRTYQCQHRPIQIRDQRFLLSTAMDVSRHKCLQRDLTRRAFYDELTNLPTRRFVENHVQAIISADQTGAARFAVAFLDVDNFKHINDYYGHAVGDALLVGFANRIQASLRQSDLLARISGDEFLLVLDRVESETHLRDIIDRLLLTLQAPYLIDGNRVPASASIGVCLYPDHGRSFDQLCANADIAMYRVKHDSKRGAAIFSSAMEHEALARAQTEQALRLAILEKRFCCAFQPKVDIRTRAIRGIEALVRLRDDSGELQAPGDFLNLAIELGLIDELSHLVLAEIMQSIKLIDANFGAGVSISINVAAKQAGNRAFMAAFAEALAATGIAERFIIEVTEDAFVAKTHFQDEILPQFRKLGVAVSIDDFGIGYSSLAALADITADEIKIDRSFISGIHRRPRSQSILRAVESLSNALGMTVVAEGVETFEELAYLLAATNIRYAQGYYFSMPIYLDQLGAETGLIGNLNSALPALIPELPSRPPQGPVAVV